MEEASWLLGNEPVEEPLNVQRELKRYEKNPLYAYLHELTGGAPDILVNELARYALAYEYFYLCLARYLTDMSVSIRWERGPRWIPRKHMSSRQRQVADQFKERAPYFELDFANALIHARILCDRTIALSRYFLVPPPHPSFQSFNDHKRFFLRQQSPYGANESYAEYIRNNTGWFDMPLKPVRDAYFIHQGPKHIRFLGYPAGTQDLQLVILHPRNPQHTKPLEQMKTIRVSVRCLARDLNQFLEWFNNYALAAYRRVSKSKAR